MRVLKFVYQHQLDWCIIDSIKLKCNIHLNQEIITSAVVILRQDCLHGYVHKKYLFSFKSFKTTATIQFFRWCFRLFTWNSQGKNSTKSLYRQKVTKRIGLVKISFNISPGSIFLFWQRKSLISLTSVKHDAYPGVLIRDILWLMATSDAFVRKVPNNLPYLGFYGYHAERRHAI